MSYEVMVTHIENVCINMYESIWNRTVGSPVEHGDADSSTDRWLWRSVSPGSRLFFLGVCNSGCSDPDGGAVRLPPHPASPLVGPITLLLYITYIFQFFFLSTVILQRAI